MARQVAARRSPGWRVLGILPDVCKTPIGSSTPPVPYPVYAELQDAVKVIGSVRANGHPVVVYDHSHVPKTLGDTPGTALGVKSQTVEGACYPYTHSPSVRAGKKPLVRHDDLFWLNGP